MRRIIFGLAFATVMAGCGQKEIPVKPLPETIHQVTEEQSEELRFLRHLSNPTWEQWKRMRQMDKSAVGEWIRIDDAAEKFRKS